MPSTCWARRTSARSSTRIDDPVEAALDIYKLYITAPGMRKETNITFARYVPQDDRETLGYATEVEDVLPVRPGREG